MGNKKIELIIHYGGFMRKENDNYKYLRELGCEIVEWEQSEIKWESFVQFCSRKKVLLPICLIWFKDILTEMKKVNYVLDTMMEDLHELCYIKDIGGSIEIFLEHDCSTIVPEVIPYLGRGDDENDENVRDYDDMADDEGDDGESNGETDEEADDGDDIERPREDDEPEQSEDETLGVEENKNENQKVHEDTNQNGVDDDDGDDVVVDEGDGAADERFSSLFMEGEQCNKVPIEDINEKEKKVREVEESDEDYQGNTKGDAVYPDTPVSSDEEWDEWTDKKRFKGKGKTKFHGQLEKEPYIWLFQTFNSGLEFKDQLLRYAMNTQYDVKMAKSEKSRIACICCKAECKWRVLCSVEKPLNQWMVKVCHMHHNHGKSSRVTMLKQGVIAGLFREELRRNVSLPAAEIKDIIKARYNIVVPISKCYRGRRIALDSILEAQAIQFGMLWRYEAELKRGHPNISTELLTRDVDGGQMFDCFYICFEEFRQSWKNNCRPVIGLDGCFLKWELNGDVLAAVGRDADNRMYPIAWAVVRGENKDTWCWFIQKLKADLNLGLGEGLTIISDKQKGLMIAMDKELPSAEHRMCARHIYANWRKSFSKSEYKNLFWGVAYSYNGGEYKAKMDEVKEYDHAAYESLLNLKPEKWCRSYFSSDSHCHDVHNNLSEAFNRTIKIARTKPVISMLEDIRRQAMRRITRRFIMSQKLDTFLTPITMGILEKARIDNKYCSTIRSSANLYEVVEFDNGYTVRLANHECACRRWDLTGIPCRHAICVLDDNQEDAEKYAADYYQTSVMRSTYEDNIKPVNGKDLWPEVDKPPIGIPEFRKPRGRPKMRDRRKEPFEDLQNAGKSTRHGRIQHCSNCGQPDHIRRSCKNETVVKGPKNKRGRPRKHPQDAIPKRPTKPRKKKETPKAVSNTQPVQPAESGGSYPAASSAPEPLVSKKTQGKKRKRGQPLEISKASNIPTVSATLMSPFTAKRFDAFNSISRGSQLSSEPKQP